MVTVHLRACLNVHSLYHSLWGLEEFGDDGLGLGEGEAADALAEVLKLQRQPRTIGGFFPRMSDQQCPSTPGNALTDVVGR